MVKKKGELLLHPVRLRIVTELAGKSLTSRQLAAALPDIPQATLYRQIKTLYEGGVLEVLEEALINGAKERTYGVVQGEARFSGAELTSITAEDHRQFFAVFMGSLLDGVDRYVDGRTPQELGEGGLSYNRVALYLSDEERDELRRRFAAALEECVAFAPSPERKRYTLASVVIPDERGEEIKS